jgi:hypothetical protein
MNEDRITSGKEYKDVAERIAKLPDQKIDELFYKIGMLWEKERNREAWGMKALTQPLIDGIKNNVQYSEAITTLFDEWPKSEILKRLEEVENSK